MKKYSLFNNIITVDANSYLSTLSKDCFYSVDGINWSEIPQNEAVFVTQSVSVKSLNGGYVYVSKVAGDNVVNELVNIANTGGGGGVNYTFTYPLSELNSVVSIDLTGFYNKTEVDNKLTLKQDKITTGANNQVLLGDLTLATLNKALVQLDNVDNTSDLNKPISNATQTALNLKLSQADFDLTITNYVLNSSLNQSLILGLIGESGVIKPEYLPSEKFNDIVVFPDRASFPAVGEVTKLYIALDNKTQFIYINNDYLNVTTNATISALNSSLTNLQNDVIAINTNITDINTNLGLKANTSDVYNKTQVYSKTESNDKFLAFPNGAFLDKTLFVYDTTAQTLLNTAITLASNSGLIPADSVVVDDTAGLPVLLNTALDGKEPKITLGAVTQYFRGDKTFQTLDKVAVGLNNVANVDTTNASNIASGTLDNSRLNANVTLQGNSFNGNSQLVKLDSAGKLPIVDGSNLTGLTKAQVNLGNVDNTSDTNKPISIAVQTALDNEATLRSQFDLAMSEAYTVYIDGVGGSDTIIANRGARHLPFKTIQGALNSISNVGQACVFMVQGGRAYSETLTLRVNDVNKKFVLSTNTSITGAIEISTGCTGIYFEGGTIASTITDNGAGTLWLYARCNGAYISNGASGYTLFRADANDGLTLNVSGGKSVSVYGSGALGSITQGGTSNLAFLHTGSIAGITISGTLPITSFDSGVRLLKDANNKSIVCTATAGAMYFRGSLLQNDGTFSTTVDFTGAGVSYIFNRFMGSMLGNATLTLDNVTQNKVDIADWQGGGTSSFATYLTSRNSSTNNGTAIQTITNSSGSDLWTTPASTINRVTINNNVVSTAGFTVGTNTITITTAGTYQVIFSIDLANSKNLGSNLQLYTQFCKNNVVLGVNQDQPASANQYTNNIISMITTCVVGDVLDFRVNGGSGTPDIAINSYNLSIILVSAPSTTATSTPAPNQVVQWNNNSNLSANNILWTNPLQVTSAGGTTTLTSASPRIITVSGTSNQTIQLPDYSTLSQFTEFEIVNLGTGILTVTNSSSQIIMSILPATATQSMGDASGRRVFTNLGVSGWTCDKASVVGKVALDTDVILGTLKFRLSLTGGVGFRLSSVTGNITVDCYGYTFYGANQTFFGATTNNAVALTTTTPVAPFSWSGTTNANNTIKVDIYDQTNSKAYFLFGKFTSTGSYISVIQTL